MAKMAPGGILAGHDAQHGPVIKAVAERFPEAVVIGPVWLRDKLL